jgi:hypothetical protein
MTSTVGTVAPPQNALQQAPASTAVSSAVAGAAVAANTVDTKPLVGSSNAPISPRIVVDPLAGPITEFLTSTGQIQTQIPSAAVVAYLRAGLTSTGLVKPTPETEAQSAQTAKNDNTVLA